MMLGRPEGRFRALLALVGVLAVVLAVVVVVSSDEDAALDTRRGGTPKSSTVTTTPTADAGAAIWPCATSAVRYLDPVDAAHGFAVDFARFVSPVVGAFIPTDARSGQVEIRPTESALVPVTTVLVRRMAPDDTWWVVGSTSSNIHVDTPQAEAVVVSPERLTGRASAFEGTVSVEVREDCKLQPLGEGFVTGSGGPTPGPFDGQIQFGSPSEPAGAFAFFTRGGEDHRVWEVTALRVRFTQAR